MQTPPIVSTEEWEAARRQLRVYRTYFINNREHEPLGGIWTYLDITALGRQEDWEDSPQGYPQTPRYAWLNWHDGYDRSAR